MSVKTWRVTGVRELPEGGTLTLSATAFGSSLERAHLNFACTERLKRSQALDPKALRAPWEPEELTFEEAA